MASIIAYLTLLLYICTAGTILIEVLQSFISPDKLGRLVAISSGFASWSELWGFFSVCFFITIIVIRVFLSVFVRVLFYFRPALREKVKESLRKKREEQKLKNKSAKCPSTFTQVTYVMLSPLMIVNGSIVNRKEGSPLVEGAVQRFVTIAKENFYIWAIEIATFFVYFLVCWAIIWGFRAARRSCAAKAPVALEEGSTEDTREVKGGIYSTATYYIQTSIIDEKLVDLDEPAPKLVDVDEPAPHAVQPVTHAPADLL